MRQRVFRGLAWSGSSQIVMQILRMVVAISLARILAPENYGLAALAIVFASLVLVFSDLGLGAAIVQRKELSEDDRCTAFWISIAAGTLFTILGIALAGPVASFYGRPEVAPLCTALSFTFIIVSLATTHEALLVRAMEFGKLERRLMLATATGAVAAIVVALATRSPWALIAQQMAEAVVSSTLLIAFSPWRPKLRFSRTSLKTLGSFSAYLVGHRTLYYFHRNADNILIGRFIGAAALGAYTLAYNLMLFPFARIAGPVQKVLAPAFARMQDEPKRMAETWLRAVRMVGTISVPALCGLVIVAPDFVRIVLGDDWSQVIPIIQVLAWVGIVQSLQSLNTDVLQARGNTRAVFRFTILFTGTHFVAFLIGLHWGVVGVAAAYAISTTFVEPVYTVITARSIETSFWEVVRAVRGVFEAALIMGAAVLAARVLMVEAGIPALPRLAACIAIGGLVYLAAYPWRAPEGWADIRGVLGGVIGRRRARASAIAAPAEG
jgi:O-antigen/teichoic acid export membrane protein